MKNLFSGLLILGLVLASSQLGYVNCSQRKPTPVPKEFSYPESPSTTKFETPMSARALSGTVTESSGSKIAKALVEIVSENGKTRLDARLTDDHGSFFFGKAVPGKHYLKVSIPGFDTLLVTVIVDKKSKATLRLFLQAST
jgi:hypothetical protein